ncbi:MAG: hypothetical protein VW894_03845 [Gammaproteobacteria bacterium]
MGSNAATGGSEDREEKKIPSYSKQFQTNYKVTKSGEVKKRIIKPIIAATPTGSALMSFADEQNYKRRLKFAEKKGLNLPSKSFEYVTSPAGKSYLDEFGYAETLKAPQGNNDNGGNGGAITSSGQVVQAPKVEVAPTTVEVSQSSTAQATPEEDILLRKRKTKSKGRSATIMTGVTGPDDGLTLGKKSLLGIL